MEREPDEYELAIRAREGDPEALATLVERTRLRLFAIAYAELRHYDDAQDAVASALLEICTHMGQLREPERIRAWMRQVVRNEAHRLRRGSEVALPRLAETDAPVETSGASVLRLDIERALRRLPGDHAQAIRLFYLEGRSLEEIAARTGRSRGTIGSWLHRGRRLLADEMREYTTMTQTGQPTTAPSRPPRTVTILHTHLVPPLLQAVVDSFQAEGYTAVIPEVRELSELPEAVKVGQAIVLDDPIAGRPAIEVLLNVRSLGETQDVPVCVLCSGELPSLTWHAYWIAGAARIAKKRVLRDWEGVGKGGDRQPSR